MKKIVNSIIFAWKSRRTWWFTATAKTRERFARTKIGSFWLGLSNLLSIAALSVVYGAVFKVENFNDYVVFLGTGLVIWNSIATSLQSASTLLRANASNIKNTNINPIFYSLEDWAFQIQSFAQSFFLVVLALSIFNHHLIPNLLIHGLLPLLNLLMFIYWVPLVICLLGAEYEDLYQLIPIALQLMFLLSPILYRKEALGKFEWTANINPLYRVLSNLRHALIHGEMKLLQSLALLLANTFGIIVSIYLLEKQRKKLPFIL